MSAYIIVDTRITDPQAYEAYKQLAKPIAESLVVSIEHGVARWMCERRTCGRQPG